MHRVSFHNGHQEKSSSAQDCYQRFKNHVEVVEHCGRSLGKHQGLIDKKLEERGLSIVTCSIDNHREAITDSREECLACAFLLGSDRKRHGKLIEDLENDHVQRNDKYPKTLVEAHNLLIHWKQDPKNLMIGSSTSNGMAFANVGGQQQPPHQDNSQTQCYNCQEMGHYASTCNNAWRAQASGAQAFMSGAEITEPEDDDISFNFLNVSDSSRFNSSVHHRI
jgi:hypothetical protein